MKDPKFLKCDCIYTDSISHLNDTCRLPDGRLMTFSLFGKPNVGGYFSKERTTQLLMSRVSEDEGKTWRYTGMMRELPAEDRLNCLGDFLISRAGKIHLFLYRIANISFEGTQFDKGDIAHIRMDDETGTNFLYQKIECLDRYTGSMNNLLQTKSGRIIAPFSTISGAEGSAFVSSVVYSDDEGETWRASNDVAVVSDEDHIESGAVEPVVAEVGDGVLVMFIRTVLNRIYYSVSYDDGTTWSEAQRSNIVSSNAPSVPVHLPDGRYLLVWNDVQGCPMTGRRYSFARHCLHAAVSDDGFKTLRGIRIIVRKQAFDGDIVKNCYPFGTVAGEHEAFISPFAVENGTTAVWADPQRYLLRLNPDALLETSVTDHLEEWVTDCAQDGDGLTIYPTGDNVAFGCGNFPFATEGDISLRVSDKIPQGLQILLADSYIDRCTFADSQNVRDYKDVLQSMYIAVSPRVGGEWRIRWNEETLEFEDASGKQKISLADWKRGFNHITLLFHGTDGKVDVQKFTMHAVKAALDTGIRY